MITTIPTNLFRVVIHSISINRGMVREESTRKVPSSESSDESYCK